MSSRHIRKSSLLGCVLILSSLIISVSAQYSSPPGGHLNVTEVFVDFDLGELVINGTDFKFGPGPTVVTFGEIGNLPIISETNTQIVAELPDVADGDYLLTVSRGKGQSQNDEYDLTIGAVGPQGPQGEQGERGPVGPQGIPGISGYEMIGPIQFDDVPDFTRQRIFCPLGKRLISCQGEALGNNSIFLGAFPENSSSCAAIGRSSVLPTHGLKITAICAFVQ